MSNFVIIVDGIAITNYVMPNMTQEEIELSPERYELIQAFSSNPVIVQWNEQVPKGYAWDGNQFIAPEPVELIIEIVE
jgi:hypothetical protein